MDGLSEGLHSVWRLSDAKSRSISPENPTGGVGMGARAEIGEGVASYAAELLGRGWKVNPYLKIGAGETAVIADIDGEGVLRHIWMTPTGNWRFSIIRVYWDGCDVPSIQCPVGDFFAMGWNTYAPISSSAVCVNPGSAFNCYWPMPFRKQCRITMENISESEMVLYYQIDYALMSVPETAAYFHARFRRVNPLPDKSEYVILDNVQDKGQYVGTYLAWGVHSNGWWGEGEVKFFMDGDGEFPTICGTGTEDYFCGSYNFENQQTHQYEPYTTQYAGLCQVIRPDGLYSSQMRFGMYRWHLADPIRFESQMRVTIQALGWRNNGRYMPLRDDIASVAYWYQKSPSEVLPNNYSREELET